MGAAADLNSKPLSPMKTRYVASGRRRTVACTDRGHGDGGVQLSTLKEREPGG